MSQEGPYLSGTQGSGLRYRLQLVAAEDGFEVDDGDPQVSHGFTGGTARGRVGPDPGAVVADEGHVDTPTPLPDPVREVHLELGVLGPPLTERSLRHGEGRSTVDRGVEVVSVPDHGLGPGRGGHGADDLADDVIRLNAGVRQADGAETALRIARAFDATVVVGHVVPGAVRGIQDATADVNAQRVVVVLVRAACVAAHFSGHEIGVAVTAETHGQAIAVFRAAGRDDDVRLALVVDAGLVRGAELDTHRTFAVVDGVALVRVALPRREVAGPDAEAIGVDGALGVGLGVVVVAGSQDALAADARAVGVRVALDRVLAVVECHVHGGVPRVDLARAGRFTVRVLDQHAPSGVVAPRLHDTVVVVGAMGAVLLGVVEALRETTEVCGTRIVVVAVFRGLAHGRFAPEHAVHRRPVAADAPEAHLPGEALVLLSPASALLAQLQRGSWLAARDAVVAEAGAGAVRVVLAGEHLGLPVEAELVVLAGGAVAAILRTGIAVVAVDVGVTAVLLLLEQAGVIESQPVRLVDAQVDRAEVTIRADQVVDALGVLQVLRVVRAGVVVEAEARGGVVPAVAGIALTRASADVAGRVVVRDERAAVLDAGRARARVVVVRTRVGREGTALALDLLHAGAEDALVVSAGVVVVALAPVVRRELAEPILAVRVVALIERHAIVVDVAGVGAGALSDLGLVASLAFATVECLVVADAPLAVVVGADVVVVALEVVVAGRGRVERGLDRGVVLHDVVAGLDRRVGLDFRSGLVGDVGLDHVVPDGPVADVRPAAVEGQDTEEHGQDGGQETLHGIFSLWLSATLVGTANIGF